MARPPYWKDCTIECERMPTCTVCGLTKKPNGRDAGMESRFCDGDCKGYYQDPTPGHLWPGELADMDREPEEDES